MTLLTERMTATDTTQPQALDDDGGDGTWVSPGAFVFTPHLPPYKWCGWLWADKEDKAAWWDVAMHGPYFQLHYDHWRGLSFFLNRTWAFLVAVGLIGEVETGLFLKTMATYTLFISGLYGECCWRILWNDRRIALSSGIFTYRGPSLQEWESDDSETDAEDVTDDEGDEEKTGHAKTE